MGYMNEVEIEVVAKDKTTAGFNESRTKARKAGDDIGSELAKGLASSESKLVAAKARLDKVIALDGSAKQRRSIEYDIKVHETTIEKFKTDIDHHGREAARRLSHGMESESRSLLSRGGSFFLSFGKQVGETVVGGVSSGLNGIGKAFMDAPVWVKALAGLAPLLAPIIGGALSSAILLGLGGGVLAAGIFSAAKDPSVQKAFEPIKKTATDIFKDFGKPFIEPVKRALGTFGALLKDLKPDFKGLATDMAPIVDQLAPALAEMAKNSMPGIRSAVKASAPLFKVLAEEAPKLGAAISEFFKSIGDSGPSAAVFFKDMLIVLRSQIVAYGKIIGWLATMYEAIHNGFAHSINFAKDFVRVVVEAFVGVSRAALNMVGNLIHAAAAAFGWVPGIGGKLKGAATEFDRFKNRANNALNGIKAAVTPKVNPSLNNSSINAIEYRLNQTARDRTAFIRVAVVGNERVGADGHRIGGYAHGGIVGAASGGLRSNRILAGEYGPEFIDVAPGSRVHTAGATQRMMAGGGTQKIVLEFAKSGDKLIDALMDMMRDRIRVQGGGNVQLVLGRG